ncbi:hypothetical protein ABLE94_05740 [Gordonia sp. VNK1]
MLGDLALDPDTIATIAGPMANGVLYMFTWGTVYNWGAALHAMAVAAGLA